jgi:hypothetical protein
MKLPFIPRSTYDAAIEQRDVRIADLKAEVARLREDHEKTVDILSCRAIGQSMYGRISPPKIEEEPEAPKQAAPDPATDRIPSPLEQDITEHGTKARGLVRRAEKRNRQQIEEAERALELAQQVGYEMAEASTNGNGNH